MVNRRNITAEAMEEAEVQPKYANTKAFDPKNYLNIKLEPNEDSKDIIMRVLPIDKNSSSAFHTIYMHTLQVSPEISKSKWKSYVCLNKTDDIDHEKLGNKCPFCELNATAYKKFQEAKNAGDEVNAERWKKISLANRPSPVSVLRCIERGHEDEGVKFLKFNERTDGMDIKSQIKKLYADRKQESIEEAKEENGGVLPEDFVPFNLLDIYEGKDLKLTIKAVYDKEGRRTTKTSISVVDYGKPKPLSRSEEQIDEWINDEKVWSDVFVAKDYDYTSIILDGGVPFFNKQTNKWVRKSDGTDGNEEENAREKAAEERITVAETKATNIVEEPENESEETEDLPF